MGELTKTRKMRYSIELPLGSRCIKYLLMFFNIVFMLPAILCLLFGVYTYLVVPHGVTHDLDFMLLPFAILLIAVGLSVVIITFLGCCGSISQNRCMITTFTSLVILMSVLEIAAVTTVYIMRDEVQQDVKDSMMDALKHDEYKHFGNWARMQSYFHCCGVNGPSDWLEHNPVGKIPRSCCSDDWNQSYCTSSDGSVTDVGCAGVLKEYLTPYVKAIGGVLLGLSVFQLLGIGFSLCLAASIKRDYKILEEYH